MASSKVQTRSRARSPSSSPPKEDFPSNQPVIKRRTRLSAKLEIPDHLYEFVQEALDLERQLQTTTSKNQRGLKSKLKDVKRTIADVAEYYKLCEFLPSNWKYDPDTAHTLVPKVFPKQTEIHTVTVENMTPNPCLKRDKLDARGSKAWMEFKQEDAAAGITARGCISYPIDERTLTPLEKGYLFDLIGHFAVNAFNISHMMYVNKSMKENIHDARFVKCYYHKLSESYLFRMTIEAIEQGYAGSYEATVECESDDGAITLDSFVLTDRKPSHLLKVSTNADMLKPKVSTKRSVYETVKDRSSDPEVCYEVTGMVRRTTCVGGYDVLNPNGWNSWCNF